MRLSKIIAYGGNGLPESIDTTSIDFFHVMNLNQIHMYEKTLDVRVGSVVRLTSKRPHGWNGEGAMDYLLGTVKTIHELSYGLKFTDERNWYFRLTDIVEVIKY